MNSYYTAYDPVLMQYIVRKIDADGVDTVHSTYHKHDLARNTARQLTEREENEDAKRN